MTKAQKLRKLLIEGYRLGGGASYVEQHPGLQEELDAIRLWRTSRNSDEKSDVSLVLK